MPAPKRRSRRADPPPVTFTLNVRVDVALLTAVRQACGIRAEWHPAWTSEQQLLSMHQKNTLAVEQALQAYLNAHDAYHRELGRLATGGRDA